MKIKEFSEVMWKEISKGELPKNNDLVWFIASQIIYVGVYWEEGKMFCMADCEGFKEEDVSHWMEMSSTKQIMSFPKNLEKVAVDIPQFGCAVTGTFERMFYNPNNGDIFPAVTLDKIYNTTESPKDKTVRWGCVFSWYKLPTLPACFTQGSKEHCCDDFCEVEAETGENYCDTIDYSKKSAGFPTTVEPVYEETPKPQGKSAIVNYKGTL